MTAATHNSPTQASEASPAAILAPPPCHNRPPMKPGFTRYGVSTDTGAVVATWVPSPFVDRCATHDGVGIGPNGESYPTAHGWLPWCATCRWNPNP